PVQGAEHAGVRRRVRLRGAVRAVRGRTVDGPRRSLRGLPGARMSADPAVRTAALEALLVEKGLISRDAVDAVVEYYERDLGPQHGARVSRRSWGDPDFRARLLADGTAAVGELGITGFELNTLVAVENTPEVHNLVVCTLCSCYPWPLLGLPPKWYKEPAY